MMGIQLLTYAALIIAVIAIVRKVIKYATLPDSLRWELYPVPHEAGERAEYGGSYFEELDWWTKPRHSDMVNEIKEMLSEILFLKGVYHNNKRVWTSSFPFHFGLYLCIGWLVMLLIGGIMHAAGFEVSASGSVFGMIIYYLTIPLGFGGLILSGLGALGLLIWRLSDANQKKFNAPLDYINLIFFIAVTSTALTAHFSADPSFAVLRGYVGSMLTFTPAELPGTIFTLEIVLVSILIAYIPLTKMSHFVAKYFLYHSIRWNDEPNERGSKIEKHIIAQLGRKVGWSASHIQTGKTWGEVITGAENE